MRANFSKPGTIFDSMSKETFSVIETIVKLKMSLLTVFSALHLHETIKRDANIKRIWSSPDITNPASIRGSLHAICSLFT